MSVNVPAAADVFIYRTHLLCKYIYLLNVNLFLQIKLHHCHRCGLSAASSCFAVLLFFFFF